MTAEIHDLGYRAYEGERAGVGWAMRSLVVHTIRRVFGLKRPGRYKILPVISLLIAFVPGVVFVGMAAFLGNDVIRDALLPDYHEYFGIISFAMGIFAALVAPDAISTDRRTGMLALYLASPLNRTTYILSKLFAVLVVMLTMTLAPLLFLLLAYTMAGAGPGGVGDFLKTLLQVIASGVLGAAFFTGISAFAASFSKRWGMASVAIIATIFISGAVAGGLLVTTDAPDELGLLDIGGLPTESVARIFGQDTNETLSPEELENLPDFINLDDGVPGLPKLPTALILLSTAGIAIGTLGGTWWRYQTVEVDR